MQDLREAQMQYEIDSDHNAQAKRLRELIDAANKGDTDLPRAHALIGRMCDLVAKELEAASAVMTRGTGGKYKKWLRALPTDVAAVIAIRECIRCCTGLKPAVHIQDLTMGVGQLYELEVRIRQAEKVNPMYMQKIHEQVKEHATRDLNHLRRLYGVAVERVFKGTVDLTLTKIEIMQIGKFGVDACYRAGLIEQERGVSKNGTAVNYHLAEEVWTYLSGYESGAVRNLISREETRMLCPPDPWTNLHDGGYLTPHRKMFAPLMPIYNIRKSVRGSVAACFGADKMPEIFQAGNYLQSIPYSMHAPSRDAILKVWKAGGGFMGVPSVKPKDKPAFPFADTWVKDGAPDDEMEVFNRWKRTVAKYFDKLREWRTHVREIGGFMRSVREAAGPYWFPAYFDSRGRWYYRGTPNPQGSDMSKAILHFHNRKPLGDRGLYWLKVHVANSFGYDKHRMDKRAQWTEENWDRIAAALDAPWDAADVWGNDAPFCMYAAAWELREAYRSGNPTTYCTGIPVHMDATCSGLQHYSALLRDPEGGRLVNLWDVGGEQKQDVYLKVAQATLYSIERDMKSDDSEIAARAMWAWDILSRCGDKMVRGLAKKPVMTYVYGATMSGTADYVEDTLIEDIFPIIGASFRTPRDAYRDCMYIASKLFAGIAIAVPRAAEAMKWLKSVAAQAENGQRMVWHTPLGFPVQHDYQDYTEDRVRLRSCGVDYVKVRDWNEDTQAHAMRNAISPNFVHALDATHLTLVANRMERVGLDMVAIHDSFGTHPADVDRLHSHIREAFVELYSGPNLLAEFLWEVGGEGDVPTRGSLDIRKFLDSEFGFS